MFRHPPKLRNLIALALVAAAFGVQPAQAQIGPVLTGVGPVNRSMGGTAVAAPVDGLGAIYWNPATTAALPNSLDFGMELLLPQTRLASEIQGLGAGSTWGDDGVFALPSVSLIYHPEDSALTYGLGMFPVMGFGVNYASSATNPILTPQPPNGVGLGALFSELQVMQIAPTVTIRLTDHLSAGVGPTLDLETLRADPLFVATPDANGQYPPGTHTRTTWGGGFQAGLFYTMDGGWNLGASVKSRQWMDNNHFNSTNEKGLPRDVYFRVDAPMIASVGVAYSGFERLLLAADFRYVDYANTSGFDDSGFDATGALRGVGWRSVFAMSLGAQYQLTDCTTVRMGYSFNQNPIPDSQSFANVVSPTIVEHCLFLGASYRVSDALTLSASYGHGFQNAISGPLVTPAGPVPGTSVQNTASADFFVFGASVQFGPHCCKQPSCN